MEAPEGLPAAGGAPPTPPPAAPPGPPPAAGTALAALFPYVVHDLDPSTAGLPRPTATTGT
eukprot:12883101-Prorocentrum_lima.AAC.1